MGLVTFADRFPGRSLVEHAARNASSVGDLSLPTSGVALDVSTVARVNTGRWIADCPQKDCEGSEYVNFNDPRFFCCECRNTGVGGVPIVIKVPHDKLRSEVEAVLLERPVPATRNWTHAETVDALKAENERNL